MREIHFFNYAGNDARLRKITVIDGIPFYCSSGANSGWPETWLPFLGLDHAGWFRKPGYIEELSGLADSLSSQYYNFFPTFDIRKRLTSVKCLLISSRIGGGFWATENGATLLARLQQNHPDFYAQNAYKLQDSHVTYAIENRAFNSVGARKIYRRVNELLEGVIEHALTTEFDAKLFYPNFIEFGVESRVLRLVQSNVIELFKPTYPEFPKTLSPTCHESMIWPTDFETSLALTPEQKVETEDFICEIYPRALVKIRTEDDYLDYSSTFGEPINAIYKNKKTHLNMNVLNNGDIIVFPYEVDTVYRSPNKGTVIFKVYNLSRGEWVVLKNKAQKTFIPYLKQLGDEPHIAKIHELTGYEGDTSIIGKLYHKNLQELISATPLTTAQKAKFMLSLLQGLNAIHKTPYRYSKSQGYLSHADIKPLNIFYDEDVDDVVIGDLDECGKWNFLTHSSCFVPPELALELLKFEGGKAYTNDNIIMFNKDKGQGVDVWNLGLVFVGLLQGRLVKHNTYDSESYFPNLKFILDRLQLKESEATFMGDMASLEQEEIDNELDQIKQQLPQTAEGQQLRQLWDIVHQMLQVSPSKRPSCAVLLRQMQMLQIDLSDQAVLGLKKYSVFSLSESSQPSMADLALVQANM